MEATRRMQTLGSDSPILQFTINSATRYTASPQSLCVHLYKSYICRFWCEMQAKSSNILRYSCL